MSSVAYANKPGRLYHSGCAEQHSCLETNTLELVSPAGADMYDMPGLHQQDNIAYSYWLLQHDCSLVCDIRLDSHARFDAAGIYLATERLRLKFGIERYTTDYRLASVVLSPYSDETAGITLANNHCRIAVSINHGVVSCYHCAGDEYDFHRAFYIGQEKAAIKLGFYTQSPFSQGTRAHFHYELSEQPIDHCRP